MERDLSNTMTYWDNGNGTFTVRSWEIIYTDRPLDLVYTQKIALDRFARLDATEMNLRLQIRKARPAIGVEIVRPGTEA